MFLIDDFHRLCAAPKRWLKYITFPEAVISCKFLSYSRKRFSRTVKLKKQRQTHFIQINLQAQENFDHILKRLVSFSLNIKT